MVLIALAVSEIVDTAYCCSPAMSEILPGSYVTINSSRKLSSTLCISWNTDGFLLFSSERKQIFWQVRVRSFEKLQLVTKKATVHVVMVHKHSFEFQMLFETVILQQEIMSNKQLWGGLTRQVNRSGHVRPESGWLKHVGWRFLRGEKRKINSE